MKLITNIQLGLKDQIVYKISNDGNEISKIAQVELQNLGEVLCGLYSKDINEVIIQGPYKMALKVESSARENRLALFGKDDMNITINKEN